MIRLRLAGPDESIEGAICRIATEAGEARALPAILAEWRLSLAEGWPAEPCAIDALLGWDLPWTLVLVEVDPGEAPWENPWADGGAS